MPKRRYYFLLCTNERAPDNPKGSCAGNGAAAVQERFTEVILRDGLRHAVRVLRTSCLDNCSRGPVLAVYPDDVWYQGVRPEDVEEILQSHLREGKPVERLVLPDGDFD